MGLIYAAFILNGFDEQERNLTFLKAYFQVENSNFIPAVLSRLSILFINDYITLPRQHKYTFT